MASHCFRPHQAWTQPVAGELCSPELGGLRLWLERGIEAESWSLGPRHGCEGDSLREMTGSCEDHRTGAYGFLLFLTEMRIKAGRAAVSRTPGRTFPTFKVGSEMGFDFSHRHKQFGQQVKSRTDRLAIAAALSN